MKIGIVGSGPVARALGTGLNGRGYDVTLGSRDPSALDEWAAAHPGAGVGSPADAAAHGEMVVLAVAGRAAVPALHLAGPANLAGKVVIDTTNPIADAPPTNGVISFFTGLDESLMERLQAEVPEARFVKAFNSVGSQHMVDPAFAGGPPTMFICGHDAGAKEDVSRLLAEVGWEVADMGGVEAARAIEPLCILWCIPGMLRNEWSHAFKLLT